MSLYQDWEVTLRGGRTVRVLGPSIASAARRAMEHGIPVVFEPVCTRCHKTIRAGERLATDGGLYVHPACVRQAVRS